MSISPPILEIQHFQNLNLKIKGQGHGWGHSSKSQWWSSILSTHIPFVPCQLSHSWDTAFSKFDLENQGSRSWVRSQFKVTMWVYHPIDSHPFRSMSIDPPILETQHSIFKIWPWKSRVKVMGEVTVEIHNVGLTSYWLIPFVPCQSALPFLIQHFQNLTLKNQGSRSNDPDVAQLQA